jgi:hypothetical protein
VYLKSATQLQPRQVKENKDNATVNFVCELGRGQPGKISAMGRPWRLWRSKSLEVWYREVRWTSKTRSAISTCSKACR